MTDDSKKNSNEQLTVEEKTTTSNKLTQTNKTLQNNKIANNKNKKNISSSSAFVINEIKPAKRTPAKMLEMQQAFFENYYNMPQVNTSGTNKETNSEQKAPSPPANNVNNVNTTGTISQIAPLFNLLGGGKNAQIGSLISALGDGKMDMNKVISAMAPAVGSGGGNLFSVFNPNKAKQVNNSPKEQTKSSETGKSIKDLNKI